MQRDFLVLLVLDCLFVGICMEAFNMCCFVTVAANLCPLTETSMCAEWAGMELGKEREGGSERERASRHYAMMSSSQWTRNTKWLFEVMVQHAQQETKHFYVCACLMHVRVARPCVCVCVWMCLCMSMCSKLEKGEDWGSTFQCSTHLPGRVWCHCPWRVTVPSMFFCFLFVFLQVTK